MRAKDIKTQSDFYKFADIWYQRAHTLREVWQNEEETDKRRAKAFKLWAVMLNRVMKIASIAVKISQVNMLPTMKDNKIFAGCTEKH